MGLDGKLVTVFGGGGFVGRYVCERLLAAGARVRIAERDPKNAQSVKPLGNLGQVQLASADVRKADSVARAVQGADMVVNLVGVFGSSDAMYAVNADGAGHVAKASADAGVQTLVHMSAIGADAASPAAYGRSRAAGEALVREAFADAIILRPSIIFGREDQFVNRFAAMITMMPVVPVIGAETRFQPVFVGDVAQAVVNALKSGGMFAGKTLELGGPEVLSMLELNKQIAAMAGRSRTFLPMPQIAAAALTLIPGGPISGDQLKMLARDNVAGEGALGLSALGITPTPLASVAHGWMDRYRLHGRFGARVKA